MGCHPPGNGADMQLKELSERTGVSPASIKFYLREGLLPAGRPVHATRAEYSDQHVSRLELDGASTAQGDLRTPGGDAVVRSRNWPDVPSDARNSLNAHLARMESLGVPVTAEL